MLKSLHNITTPGRRTGALVALLLALGLGAVGSLPNAAGAQQIPPRSVLENLTPEEIRERLRASGLSEAQVRDRLRQAGYDPSLADRYFDESSGRLAGAGPEDQEFLQILQTLGVRLRAGGDTLAVVRDSLLTERGDSLEAEPDSAKLEVFGIDVFNRRTNQFSPSPTVAAGPQYPLGPGDEIILVLTGDVQLAHRLQVSSEGVLVIPQVGQISVNGLTLGDLEQRLYGLLGQVYSGVRRGPDASTQFSVSLGRLRSIQVYVLGEVSRPGSYSLSPLATTLEALYAAGGPRETGSFRNVTVRRGGRLLGGYDLYDYLTEGSTAGALRLAESDVVFVPPIGEQVALSGEVIRPALYEVLPEEGLPALIGYSGGLKPSARSDVARVDRIVSWNDRTRGRDRVILDVDLGAVMAGVETFDVKGGDEIEIFSVLDTRRDWVAVRGAVYRPGRYQFVEGATLERLLQQAGGPLPDALDPVVHVSSLDQSTGERSLVRLDLDVASSVPLQEFDEVTLFGRDSLLIPDSVGVYGLVRRPGRYPLARGATAEDVILDAGGFAFGADPRQAEVIRMVSASDDGVSVSRSLAVELADVLPVSGPAQRAELPPPEGPISPSSTVLLEPGDEVYVRQIPQFREPRRVQVTGEVRAPGTYVLERMDESVASVIERAGGLTSRAFPQGFRLLRDGITVGVDLREAMSEPLGPEDPVLVDGDRLVVPIYDGTVLVTGAVAFATRVVYRDGLDLGDVISQAGGLTPDADKGRISVEYANGSRQTVNRFLGLTVSTPDIRPGSSVFVPESADTTGINWDQVLSRTLAVASTLATVYIAVK